MIRLGALVHYCSTLIAFVSMCCAGCRETEPVTAHRQPFNFWGPGYNRYKLFVYKASIVDSTGTIISNDTLGLYCAKQSKGVETMSQWQFLTRTQGLYQPVDSPLLGFTEGTFAGDSFFYMHPFRDFQYSILRFSPNPYFENKPIGSTWEWRVEMGKLWEIRGEYEFATDSVDSLLMTYTFVDTPTLSTYCGPVICNRITATATSPRHGKSTGTFYWNDNLGLVKSAVHTVSGKTITFEQIYATERMAELERNRAFMFEAKQLDSIRNIRNTQRLSQL